METELRVPPQGLTDILCNFGSGVSALSNFHCLHSIHLSSHFNILTWQSDIAN